MTLGSASNFFLTFDEECFNVKPHPLASSEKQNIEQVFDLPCLSDSDANILLGLRISSQTF